MTTNIIIVYHNQAALTIECIRSIKEHTEDYRLWVVDNNSDYADFDRVTDEFTLLGLDKVQFFPLNENLGFVKAVNSMFAMIEYRGRSEFVVLLNNDTTVVGGWLDKLLAPMQENTRIGAVGPVTTTLHSWQGREKVKPGWRILPESAMLAFFCVAIRQSVVDEVGRLDESFGNGLGDDDDYCHRIKQAGYKLALASDLVIPHHHRTTFSALYSPEQITEMEEAGRARFKEKHGL